MNKVLHNGDTYYELNGQLFPKIISEKTTSYATPKRVQHGDAPIVARGGGDSPIQIHLGWAETTNTFHTNGMVANYKPNANGRYEIVLGMTPKSPSGF